MSIIYKYKYIYIYLYIYINIYIYIFQYIYILYILYYIYYIYIYKSTTKQNNIRHSTYITLFNSRRFELSSRVEKSLHSKRRELNKVTLRAVSYVVLLRCRLIYNQHYAPYEHIYIYIFQHTYIYIIVLLHTHIYSCAPT